MKKKCTVFFDKVPGRYISEDLPRLFQEHDIEFKVASDGRKFTEDQLIRELKDVDATVSSGEPYTARVLDSANRLRIIQCFGVGYENIDVKAATRRGIFVGIISIPEISKGVADETFALILSTLRMIPQMNRHVREGCWDRERFPVRDAYPLTLGILGLGKIGTEVARRARRGFEMKVIYYDLVRNRGVEKELDLKYVFFQELLKESDILSIHVPLNESTKGLIGEKEIAMMKEGAILINEARGLIVDETALYKALESGKLSGAGIGVQSKEPPTLECPFYNLGSKLPNVVLIPHTGAGKHTMIRATIAAAEGVIAVLEGRKPREGAKFVNPKVLKKIPLED